MIGTASAADDASGLAWFKSSYSSSSEGDSCVEVALSWFKSSYSSGSEGDSCVELALTPDTVHVRDSKYLDAGPRFTVRPETWAEFVEGLV